MFPGDFVVISQEFAVEDWRDTELREDEALLWGGVGGWEGVSEPGTLRWGLSIVPSADQFPPLISKTFLPSMDVVGDNVDFPKWQTEWRCR
jgi:hypothetical protein